MEEKNVNPEHDKTISNTQDSCCDDFSDTKESVPENTIKKADSRRDMRALAFHFIYAVDRFDYTVPLEEIIKNFREGFDLEIEDDAPAAKMAQGTISSRVETDELIKPLLRNWKLERLGCCTRLILRLAIWELHQEDAIPSIIINEAIELAKCFAEKDAYKFINGILDEASKNLNLPEEETEE